MSDSYSTTTVLIADKDLYVKWANTVDSQESVEHIMGRPSAANSFIGSKLLDVVDLSNEEMLHVCNTIFANRKFPGGTKSYRKVISSNGLDNEHWIIVVGPHAGANGCIDGIVYAKFRTNDYYGVSEYDLEPSNLYKCLVDNSSDIIYLIDRDGIVRFLNHYDERYKGLHIPSLLGKHFSEVVHPDDVDKCREAVDRIFSNGEPVADFSYRIQLNDGSVLHLIVNSYLIRSQGTDKILGICRDVTEPVELQAKLVARNKALSALNEIVVALYDSVSLENAFSVALNKILDALNLEHGAIVIKDEDDNISVGTYYEIKSELQVNSGNFEIVKGGLSNLTIEKGEIVIVSDMLTDTRFSERYRAEMVESGINAAVGIPLKSGKPGNAVLILAVNDPSEFTLEQKEFVSLAAGILGPAIENARLKSDLAAHAKQLAMLERLARSVNAGLDVQNMLEVCFSEIEELIDYDWACVFFVENDGTAEIYTRPKNGKMEPVKRKYIPPVAVERLRNIDKPTAFQSAESMKAFHNASDFRTDIESGACALLKYNGQAEFGVLKLLSRSPCKYGKRELEILQAAADHLAIAVSNARHYEAERNKSHQLETLAREAQHRIMNNLQMISGLLGICESDGESNKKATARCLRQIRAIATVQELVTPKNVSIDMEVVECLASVAESAIVGTGCSERISLDVTGDKHSITSNAATALGIIINELVSNAVEHGFAEKEHGNIRIVVKKDKMSTSVEVSDDGSGLPVGFVAPQAPNCGLGLASSLVTYGLGGKLEIDSSELGTRARITF